MLRSFGFRRVVAALAMAGVAVLAARRWMWPHVVELRPLVDGREVWPEAGARWVAWESPERLAGLDGVVVDRSGATISADGRWIVFAAGAEGERDLVLGELVEGAVRDLQPIAALNTAAEELSPSFANDALYFASNRAGGAGGFDVYRAAWDGAAFAAAAESVRAANTEADELDPCCYEDELYFASNRVRYGRSDFDLYCVRETEEGPSVDVVAESSSTLDERDPSVAARSGTLWFSRGDADREELWFAPRWRGERLPAERARGISDELGARAPEPSADGFTLYLTARDADGAVSLARSRTIELFRGPQPVRGWAELVTMALLALVALTALLSERWRALDPIYKCLLASLLLHLLVMWLLRGVHPKGDPWELEQRGEQRYRVRLERPTARADVARDGELAMARAAPAVSEAPRRVEAPREELESNLAAPSPAAPIAREAARFDDSAPQRTADVGLERSRELGAAEVASIAAPDDAPERRSASAARAEPPSAGPTSMTPREVVVTTGPSAIEVERRGGDDALEAPREAGRLELTASDERVVSPAASDATASLLRAPSASLEKGGPSLEGPREPRSSRSAAAAPSDAVNARALEVARSSNDAAQAPSRSAESARSTAAPGVEPSFPEAGPIARRASTLAEASAPAARELELEAPSEPRSAFAAGPQLAAPNETTVRRSLGEAPAAPRIASAPMPSRSVERDSEPTREFAPQRRSASEPQAAPREAIALAPAPRSVDATAPAPRRLDDTPYRSRFGPEKEVALREHGGTVQTERAVAAGLAYLARLQNRDGSWGDRRDRSDKYRDVRVGKTALALLAFLGAGHTPGARTEHAAVAERAVTWLLAQQSREHGHFGDSEAYSHGIATYALAECFALERDERLRLSVAAAVDRILSEQIESPDPRRDGGWSYFYPDGATFDRWPRASITAWQVMALESARLGGLAVPDDAFDAAREFLVRSWDGELGRFRYSHDPRRLGSGYPTLPGSTPAALFALALLGEELEAPAWAPALQFLARCAPRGYGFESESAFVERAQGNLYFWYYGSLALLRRGGDDWNRWNAALKETLLPAQDEDGSWAPIDVYCEYAGDTDDQRVYSTAMCVLSLEVYYRYFTPLLRVR